MTKDEATALLQVFHGREGFIAYQPEGGTFKPLKLDASGVPLDKFLDRHTQTSSCGFYLLTASSLLS